MRVHRVEPGLHQSNGADRTGRVYVGELYKVGSNQWQATLDRSWITTTQTMRAAKAELFAEFEKRGVVHAQ